MLDRRIEYPRNDFNLIDLFIGFPIGFFIGAVTALRENRIAFPLGGLNRQIFFSFTASNQGKSRY